jgi:response regulator NasT
MAEGPLRVVIAEDDSFVAEVIAADLATAGLTVAGHAFDGEQAVAMTAALQPDVVLLDVRMPKVDGLAAAAAIQEQCPTPVVILSAFDEQRLVEQGADAGIGAFVTKPSSAAELLRAITVARARFADLARLRRMNTELREALASVRTLSGFLPICAKCKKIRDERGGWHSVELYVSAHSSAHFSHSLCPACVGELYPGQPVDELADD